MRNTVVASLALLGLAACGSSSEAPTPATIESCAALKGQTLGGAFIDDAVVVQAAGRIGEYCKVNGTIRTALKFQVNLPTAWDGARLVHYGGGGWDGVLALDPDPSQASAVSVASNGGHTSSAADPSLDASFALNNPQGQQDFGHQSGHATLLAAKEIVRRRFGRDAQRHYFRGCSNGGREALIQATRWPEDYDGILSIAPGYSFSELAHAFVRNSQAFLAAGGVNAAKAATIANAVVARCDALDGLADGIVSKPLACHFDPAGLRCTGADNNGCLTDAQVAAARTAYGEVRDSASKLVYPGWEAGGEDLGWPAWVSNPPSSPVALQFLFANGMVKYWLTDNPGFEFLLTPNFSVEQYPAKMASFKATVDATPDLRTFFSQGRKLVLAHGMHDWALSYKATVGYFDKVGATTGAPARDANMEFFLLPGVQHCGGGVGADAVDLFEPVTRWVETGTRPSSRNLTVYKFGQNGLRFTRPLCRYPTFPRYKGSGDPNQASSFTCSAS